LPALPETIENFVLSLGLELIGITDGSSLLQLREELNRRNLARCTTPFETTDKFKRTDPAHILPGCRSIIILALPYRVPEWPEEPAIPAPQGKVARCARGLDYHLVMEQKASRVVDYLKDNISQNFTYRICVDKTPLVERALALKAGGSTGCNGTLITSRFGSWVSPGEILLDIPLPAYTGNHGYCIECGKCQEICPTGVLNATPYPNFNNCISFITQNKSFIPPEAREKMGLHTYGCDLCQEVCPANKHVFTSPIQELQQVFLPAHPLLIPFLSLSKKEYALTAGATSARWCKQRTLLRNAVINLGNSQDERAVPALSRLLHENPRSDLRGYAAWALGKTGGARAKKQLELSLAREHNRSAAGEIIRALETSSHL